MPYRSGMRVGRCEAGSPEENGMRIVILRSAIEDLVQGRDYYDLQGEGLGDYFEESINLCQNRSRSTPVPQ